MSNYNGPAKTIRFEVAAVPALQKFDTGWRAGYVTIENETTGNILIWSDTMPNGDGNLAGTHITTDGITLNDGTDGLTIGVTLGVLTGLSDVATEVLNVTIFQSHNKALDS